MTSPFPEQQSDTRIFVFSALGSLLLHGLLMASLAYMPNTTIIENDTPTVRVTLFPSPRVLQTPQTPSPPLPPRTVKSKTPPPPMPFTQPNRSQPPPLQAILTPSLPMKRSPLTPPVPAKPILKDTRASQALKAREMMKMRVPSQTQRTSPFLPTVNTQTDPAKRSLPPMPKVRKERSASRPLPAPPTSTTPRTLTATPPSQTGSTMTRPTIISSSRPIYPRVARESGWEGTVIVRTLIDTNGVPSQVKIRKSCGHPTLDQAAQDAVKFWTFQPAKDGNIPITKWVDIPIKFELNS